MVNDVAEPERRQRCQKQVVSPAPGKDQRNADHHRQHRQEAQFGKTCDRGGNTTNADQTSDTPKSYQGNQQPTPRSLSICPVLDRGQQETREDCHRETEDHLVAMPGDALQSGLPRQTLVIGVSPPGDEACPKQSPKEEERTETLLEKYVFHRAMIQGKGGA